MITHKGLQDLIESPQFELEESAKFIIAYRDKVTAITDSFPWGKTPMTATHLKVAIQLIETSSRIEDPRFLAILDILKEELDKLQPHSRRANAQQALQQAREELKKAQAENEQLRKELQQVQTANEQLKTLIHQLQTQPLSKQLKKLTEMAQQLENELEQEQAARARAEAAVNQTSDGHTTIIHAQHVSLTDIHHNDNNNTHIKS